MLKGGPMNNGRTCNNFTPRGTLYWRDAFKLAAEGYCVVCKHHQEMCSCDPPSHEVMALREEQESRDRMVALAGWVVYALLMFGVAMAVMYVDVIAEWVGL